MLVHQRAVFRLRRWCLTLLVDQGSGFRLQGGEGLCGWCLTVPVDQGAVFRLQAEGDALLHVLTAAPEATAVAG